MNITDNILKKIKEKANQKNISIRQLCIKNDISEAGFYKMFKIGSLKIKTLEKFAKILEVHISYFFINSPNSQIIENKEVSKQYIISEFINEKGEKIIRRENKGFPSIQLLGLLELASKEIVLMITQVKDIIPERIERIIYMPKEEQNS